MSLTINSNIPSLRTDKDLNKRTSALGSNFEKLSSGKEINKASDNPAALAIAMDLLTNADTSTVASRNISDAVSVANIVDSSLSSASDITTRLNELSTQASNGTLSDPQRSVLNDEFQALSSELDRIAQTTEFNGQQLLSSDSTINIQAGTTGDASSQIGLSLRGVSSSNLGLAGADISTQAGAQQSLSQIKSASQTLSSAQGEVGSAVSRLNTAFENLKSSEVNQREAASRILDVDVAQQSSNLVANRIGQQASLSVKAQANLLPELALKILG